MISARQPRAYSSDQTRHSSQRRRVNRSVSGVRTRRAYRGEATMRASAAEQPWPLARAGALAEPDPQRVDLQVQFTTALGELALLFLQLAEPLFVFGGGGCA